MIDSTKKDDTLCVTFFDLYPIPLSYRETQLFLMFLKL